jgi:hypothetical protein
MSDHIEEEIDKRIKAVKTYRELCEVLKVEEQSSGSQKSYVLVHIRVLGDKHVAALADTDEFCGSTYIRDKVLERMETILDRKQIANFFYLAGGGGRASAFMGQLFQPLVQRILCRPDFWAEEEKHITYLGTCKPKAIDAQQNQQEHPSNAPSKRLHLDRGMHVVECITA